MAYEHTTSVAANQIIGQNGETSLSELFPDQHALII